MAPPPMQQAPRVTIIVPTYDGIETFPHFLTSLDRVRPGLARLLVVRHRNESLDRASAREFDQLLARSTARRPGCDVAQMSGAFNYSAMMNAALRRLQSQTEYLCFANDDIILGTDGGLERMVEVLDSCPDIGIVGCKLVYPDTLAASLDEVAGDPLRHFGLVQHAGICLVQDKGTTHIHKGRPTYHHTTNPDRDVDAVTFAMALLRSNLFEHLAFDEELDFEFNDVDLCLQAAERGARIRYCGSVVNLHLETTTRRRYGLYGKKQNKEYFCRKWAHRIAKAPTLDEFTRMEPYHK